MPRLPPDPQKLQIPAERRQRFVIWLCEQIQQGLDARAVYMQEGGLYDTWHAMYEQARRPRPNAWPGAADLASFIPTEKIDALDARLSDVVLGHDPVCTVEGWGEPASKVAKVEAFHQWKLEDTHLDAVIERVMQQALIEKGAVMEVSEAVMLQKRREPFVAKALTDEFGNPVLGEDLRAQPQRDAAEKLVKWSGDAGEARVEITREVVEYRGLGPQYATLAGKDFLFLPVDARSLEDVWGYAKRVYPRLTDLRARVDAGIYDKDAVAQLGTDDEKKPLDEFTRQGVAPQPQDGPTARKEVWEVQLLHDIDDDDIEEWLIACVSVEHQVGLRVAFDNVAQPRFVYFNPYPCDYSVWGYSFLGDKLETIAEEHTALRNMKADRQALKLNAPMTLLSTSDYDPDDQPFAPHALIRVRSHDEFRPMAIEDVPSSVYEGEAAILGASERITGLGDAIMSGVTNKSNDPTATEVRAVSSGSYIRVKKPTKSIQRAIETLYGLNNVFWQRALAADEKDRKGAASPMGQMTDQRAETLQTASLLRRGLTLPTEGPFAVRATDLVGSFRFKPAGSVESADPQANIANFLGFVKTIPMLLQLAPGMAQRFAANPAMGEELFEQAFRLFKMPSLQVLFAQGGMTAPQGAMPDLLAQGLPGLLAGMGGGGAPAPPAGPPALLGAPAGAMQ